MLAIASADTFKRRLKTYLFFCKFYDLEYPINSMQT